MKILIISNYYPPYYIGGYELGCRDVVEELKKRGHRAYVLTSNYGVTDDEDETDIRRSLSITIPSYYTQERFGRLKALLRREQHNQRQFRQICAEFKPDIVYFWNMASLSISLAFVAQRLQLKICFFVSEHWLSQWERDDWYASIYPSAAQGKALLRALVVRTLARARGIYVPRRQTNLDLDWVQFCSQFLKDAALKAGKQVQKAKVIHWGVDQVRFPKMERSTKNSRLLFVGRIVPEKGVHTVVEAMRLIVLQYGRTDVTLTIVGGSNNPDYLQHLEELTDLDGLSSRIQFTGSMPREQLPSLYQTHDILIFPSIWEEPFGITPLEAMATGMTVVGTLTGGSPEIFQSGINALVFCKEDAEQCAAQIISLLNDPILKKNISEYAYETVQKRFSLQHMVTTVENSLLEQMSKTKPS